MRWKLLLDERPPWDSPHVRTASRADLQVREQCRVTGGVAFPGV